MHRGINLLLRTSYLIMKILYKNIDVARYDEAGEKFSLHHLDYFPNN